MKAIILAAGKGKRMKSDLPKALHTAAGKPMIHYVIDTCMKAGIEDITVVIGKGGELIQKAVTQPVRFVWQDKQLGTGHATLCAKEHITDDDRIVVLYGDTPLITAEFLINLSTFQQEKRANGVVVAARVPDPTGLGRVIVTKKGQFEAIVEQKDLTLGQHTIDLINTGLYMSTGRELLYGLERLKNNNNQQEYYLTDVPKIVMDSGSKVVVYNAPDHTEFMGVNSQKQLADAAAVLRRRIIDYHYENGAAIIDPSAVYIDDGVEIEPGAVILPGTMIQGNSKIGEDAVIGPHTQIKDSIIGPRTTVRNSVVEDAEVGADCTVGPFAYLRNEAKIGDNCRIGDFVEIKKSTLGNGTKAAHLAYIGDAEVGEKVNFGCGTVTVNYDGKHKHKTIVEDGAFIGSNVNLVAPVVVHSGAYVAAGSTINLEVPADALAIARERQTNKEGGARKYKK
ncbi:MAG: bifunctional UDP-N-acetylglucosamine diphosphorylase/glucosamine-1-phosphate N-acetyltransferase GlmU [Defluviitaleaceae bacterium]|nr:bifunctional UDP-N-acetylglucosamine diphosphorylase/glucosamine-1-phosphate N-acetyltransferase GlmU [Defluviitaleaceae bacterium]